MAGRHQRAQIDGAQQVVFGQDQLGGDQVLAHRADVLPRCDRGQDLEAAVAQILDLLGHDNGVGLGRQWIAGVHPGGLSADLQLERRAVGRAQGDFGAHGDAVHRRGVVVRHADAGEDRRRGGPPQGLSDWQVFAVERLQCVHALECRPKTRERVLERDVLQVHVTWRH